MRVLTGLLALILERALSLPSMGLLISLLKSEYLADIFLPMNMNAFVSPEYLRVSSFLKLASWWMAAQAVNLPPFSNIFSVARYLRLTSFSSLPQWNCCVISFTEFLMWLISLLMARCAGNLEGIVASEAFRILSQQQFQLLWSGAKWLASTISQSRSSVSCRPMYLFLIWAMCCSQCVQRVAPSSATPSWKSSPKQYFISRSLIMQSRSSVKRVLRPMLERYRARLFSCGMIFFQYSALRGTSIGSAYSQVISVAWAVLSMARILIRYLLCRLRMYSSLASSSLLSSELGMVLLILTRVLGATRLCLDKAKGQLWSMCTMRVLGILFIFIWVEQLETSNFIPTVKLQQLPPFSIFLPPRPAYPNYTDLNIKQFKFRRGRMRNNSLVEIKIKANEFIEDYQRQVTEREYQKQKLKQNIMLQIMSNRHKSQASQSGKNSGSRVQSIAADQNLKGSSVAPLSDYRQKELAGSSQPEYTRSNSVPNALRNSGEEENFELQNADVTFKGRQSTEKFPQTGFESANELSPEKEPYQNEEDPMEEIIEIKKAEQFQGQTFGKKSEVQSKLYSYQPANQSRISRVSQQFKVKEPEIAPLSDQDQPESSRKDEDQQYAQEEAEEGGGVFLTMDEEQSMEVSELQKKKNYAFDIVMDKSDVVEDIDELRRKKIEQMEKKRQQRIEQFRKQQQLKDNKRSNSSLRATQKSSHNISKISDNQDQETSKSKGKRKIDSDKEIKANPYSVHQSSYNMKPPQPQRSSYVVAAQKQSNRLDLNYNQTPKTVMTEYRVDKSKGKSTTIFRGESPKRLDKSASKYSQQPKIEPKERKNTFTKQSNKKLMITALTYVCLPGELNRKERERLTEVIQKQPAQFLIFLFKQYSRKVIKAIYVLDASQTCLFKIYGDKAPQEITAQNVQSFYRFDSGSRQFKKLDGCKSFSLVVHAIDLA